MKAKEPVVVIQQILPKPRQIRSDAKLGKLTDKQWKQVEEWHRQEGREACREHILTKWGITVSPSTLAWARQRRRALYCYSDFGTQARAQVEAEEAAKREALQEKYEAMTFEQMEEAVDRRFITMASEKEDQKLYKDMRYLRIADKTAKNSARIAEVKLGQDDRKLVQRNKALELAERKVLLLEKKVAEMTQATENHTLTAEERAQRIREILGE